MQQPNAADYDLYVKDLRALRDFLEDLNNEMSQILTSDRNENTELAIVDFVYKHPEDYIQAWNYKRKQIDGTLLFAQKQVEEQNAVMPEQFPKILRDVKDQCDRGIQRMKKLHQMSKRLMRLNLDVNRSDGVEKIMMVPIPGPAPRTSFDVQPSN